MRIPTPLALIAVVAHFVALASSFARADNDPGFPIEEAMREVQARYFFITGNTVTWDAREVNDVPEATAAYPPDGWYAGGDALIDAERAGLVSDVWNVFGGPILPNNEKLYMQFMDPSTWPDGQEPGNIDNFDNLHFSVGTIDGSTYGSVLSQILGYIQELKYVTVTFDGNTDMASASYSFGEQHAEGCTCEDARSAAESELQWSWGTASGSISASIAYYYTSVDDTNEPPQCVEGTIHLVAMDPSATRGKLSADLTSLTGAYQFSSEDTAYVFVALESSGCRADALTPPSPLPEPDGLYHLLEQAQGGSAYSSELLGDVSNPVSLFSEIGCTDSCPDDTPVEAQWTLTDKALIVEPAFSADPEGGEPNGEIGDGDPEDPDCGGDGGPSEGSTPSADNPSGGGVTSDSVYLVTGDKIESMVDLVVAVTGEDLRIVRGYSSDPGLFGFPHSTPGLVGANWELSCFRKMWWQPDHSLKLGGPPMHKFTVFRPLFSAGQVVGWGPGGFNGEYAGLYKGVITIDGVQYEVLRLGKPGGGFTDYGFGFPKRIVQTQDAHGNTHLYRYTGGSSGDPVRLDAIYVNGDPSQTTGPTRPEAIVRFSWLDNDVDHHGSVHGRLDRIEVERFIGAGATTSVTQTVDYRYIGEDTFSTHADVGVGYQGLLAEVVQKTLVDDAPTGTAPHYWTRVTQYRYHETETAGTESDARLNARGTDIQLEMVILPEQVEYFANAWGEQTSTIKSSDDAAAKLRSLGDDATDIESTGIDLLDLCAKIVDYDDTTDRVTKQWVQSSCGCGGGSAHGVRLEYDYFDYDWNNDTDRPGMTARIKEYVDDGTGTYALYRRTYHDFERLKGAVTGGSQPNAAYMVSKAIVEDGTSNIWATVWGFEDFNSGSPDDAYGRLSVMYTTSAVTSYDPCDADDDDPQITTNTTGLAYAYAYPTKTSRVTEVSVSDGAGGWDIVAETDYVGESDYTWTDDDFARTDLPEEVRRYTTDSASPTADQIEVTNFVYGFHSGDANPTAYVKRTVERELESENGPGGTVDSYELFDTNGNNFWTATPNGNSTDFTLTYREFGDDSGRLTGVVRNAVTVDAGGFANGDLPGTHAGLSTSGWGTATGSADELVTTYARDLLGRVQKVVSPGDVERYTVREMRANIGIRTGTYYFATVDLPFQLSDDTFDGPATVTWSNADGDTIRVSQYTLDDTLYDPLNLDYTFESPLTGISAATAAPQGEITRRVVDHSIAGLVTSERVWHDVSASASYTTSYEYDGLGRVISTVDPNGTLSERDYDVMDRVIEVRVGRDETGTQYDPVTVLNHYYDSGQTTTPGVGNGNLTLTRQHEDGSTTRDTKQYFDHRDRLIAVAAPSGADAPDQVVKYDNLDRVIAQAAYAEGNSHTLSSVDPSATNGSRGAYSERAYSQRGMVYEERTAIDPSASSPDFLESNVWYDDRGRSVAQWGANGPGVKRVYDALDRSTVVSVTDRADDVNPGGTDNYDDAVDTAGDHVIEQTLYGYNAASRVDVVTRYLRQHDELTTTTGDLGVSTSVPMYTAFVYDDALRRIGTVGYGTNTVNDRFEEGGTVPTAPTSLPDRGTNPQLLIDSVVYDERGMVRDLIDPAGSYSRTLYDDMGRTVATAENFDEGAGTALAITWDGTDGRWTVSAGYDYTEQDADRVTSFQYDGLGNVVQQVAHLAVQSGGSTVEEVEITEYVYGTTNAASPGSTDSLVASGSLLKEVHYPDESTGEAGATDVYKVFYGYNRLGELRGVEDQNGTIHEYDRDILGRVTADTADVLGTDISGWARRIEVAYDSLGRLGEVTSYSDTSGTTAENGVKFAYNELWQVTKVFQDHNGAVTESAGSPSGDTEVVTYAYSQEPMASGNYSRLASIGYPASGGSPTVTYDYGTGINDAISRLYGMGMDIDDDTTDDDLVEYSYIGMGMFATVDYPVPDFGLDRTVQHNGTRTSGTYHGIDRHGRVLHQMWVDGGFTTHASLSTVADRPPIVEEIYAYDASSNRIGKKDNRPGAHVDDRDWNYSYDGLDRLDQADRGVAVTVGSPTGFTSAVGSRDWDLDMLGNWQTTAFDLTGDGDFGDTDESQTRTHDLANELESATKAFESFSSVFTYDDAGNLKQEERTIGMVSTDVDYTHDAWNRLVKIKQAPNDQGVYEYNGLNWRTLRGTDGDTQTIGTDDERRYYYSASWQVLEERYDEDFGTSPGTDRIVQQVWGARYIDDAVLRRVDRDADESFADSGDGIFYMASDIQFSVVAVLDDGGALYERVAYSPYGRAEHRWGGDVDADGDVDIGDALAVSNAQGDLIGDGNYRADYDLDRDGAILPSGDSDDVTLVQAQSGKAKLADGRISGASDATGPDNQVGYCGYMFNYEDMLYCVRFRHYSPRLGRWLETDPIEFVDGVNLYEYVRSGSTIFTDPFGLVRIIFKYNRHGAFTSDEQERINELIEERLKPCIARLIKELDTLEGSLSPCVGCELQGELSGLRDRLQDIDEFLAGDSKWNISMWRLPKGVMATTQPSRPSLLFMLISGGEWVVYTTDSTRLSITGDNDWREFSDDKLLTNLFHELIHIAEGWEGKDMDGTGGLVDASNIDPLCTQWKSLDQHSTVRTLILRAESKCGE